VVLIVAIGVRGNALSDAVARVKDEIASNCAYEAYDLSPLAGMTYNGTDSSYRYLLNVCSVSSEAACQSKGGSLCQYSMSPPPRMLHVLSYWTNDGVWSQLDPNDPSKGVQVTFANGDICGTNPRQVTHEFPCKPGTLGTSFTIKVSPTNACWYILTFPTSASCGSTPVSSCVQTVSGFTYDLSSLYDDDGLNTTDKNGFLYRWNPCGVVQSDERCAAVNGTICQSTRSIPSFSSDVSDPIHSDVNTSNTELAPQFFTLALWDTPPQPTWTLLDPNRASRGVVATYNNGQVCPQFGKPRTVIQQFECAPETSGYTVAELAPCQYTIKLATPAACPLNP